MEWTSVAQVLFAIGAIVTAYGTLRRLALERETSASTGWKEMYQEVKADLNKLEAAQAENNKQMAAARQRVRELERAHIRNRERIIGLEKDHMGMVQVHKEDLVRIQELVERQRQTEAKLASYKKVILLLFEQIRALGHEPAARLDDEETADGSGERGKNEGS